MFISDAFNHRVRKVDRFGIISTYAGVGITGCSGDGGPATLAKISSWGLVLDAYRNLFIADCSVGESRIAKVDTNGIISTFAGTDTGYIFNGDGIPATLANIGAYRMQINGAGELFFADPGNNRIRKIDRSGLIQTVAGDGVAGYSGDGGPATLAELYTPTGAAFDECGSLVFPDLDNYRIRKVTFPGTATASIHIAANPGDTICPGMPVTFSAAVGLGGRSPGYQWVVNGVAVGTDSTYTFVPANGDSVQCVLTSSSPCAIPPVVTSNVVVIVYRFIGITLAGPAVAAVGSSVSLTGSVTGVDTAYTVKWNNRGVLFNTTTTPVVTYTKAQPIDSITAEVIYNYRDCSQTATSPVHIVTDHGAGLSAPQAAATLSCYPSPAQSVLYISAPFPIQSLSITNLVGQVVYDTHLPANTTQAAVAVKNWQPGVYFVRVVGADGGVAVQRFVME